MRKARDFSSKHAAALSSIGLVLLVGAATALGFWQRRLGGFWEIRYVELLSFAGTALVGAWVAYFVSKRLASISSRQQMVMGRLVEIDAAVRQLHQTWSRHCDDPNTNSFREITTGARSLGVLVSSVADLDGIDAEDLREKWIQVRKLATMHIGASAGLAPSSQERTRAETAFDDCRVATLRLASDLFQSA